MMLCLYAVADPELGWSVAAVNSECLNSGLNVELLIQTPNILIQKVPAVNCANAASHSVFILG